MDLSRELKSVVIIYSDMNCVRLSGPEAEKFREVIQELVSNYALNMISNNKPMMDLKTHFNYETIRPSLLESDIVQM